MRRALILAAILSGALLATPAGAVLPSRPDTAAASHCQISLVIARRPVTPRSVDAA